MSHAYWSQFSREYLADLQGMLDHDDDQNDDLCDDQDEEVIDFRSYSTRVMDDLGITWRDFI